MSMRFHVLASGSAGNASVLEAGDFGVLIDFGLSLRTLTFRLDRCGLSWNRIHAVLLTHAHGDHWQASVLSQLGEQGLPIYLHREHASALKQECPALAETPLSALVRFYEPGQLLRLHADCECLPIALAHDGAMTCGFRFAGGGDRPWALGYAADLGCWSAELAQTLADVDFLALEFNHDVALQLRSGRHPQLIRRVLGDDGHLSNEQAGALLAAILEASRAGRLQAVVQLHLSRQCNHPDLARRAAARILQRFGDGVRLHTARQDRVGPTLSLAGRRPEQPVFVQAFLPFANEAVE